MLTRLMVVIISQYIQVPNHYFVHLKQNSYVRCQLYLDKEERKADPVNEGLE